MQKNQAIKISALIAVIIALATAYYFLLHENRFGLSINAMVTYANAFEAHMHAFVMGLIPVYIAAIIFGAAVLGLAIHTRLQSMLSRLNFD